MTIAVYPASFDPITNGHLDVARRAARLFDEVILAVAHRPNKNLLFTTEQRLAMIREAVDHLPNIRVDFFETLVVEYAQQVGATVLVRGLRASTDFEHEFQMAHINHCLTPMIETVCLMADQQYTFLSSSAVREIAAYKGDVGPFVPPHVAAALTQVFAHHEEARR
ncbi:MAG: pantetheine-phosphate adenylyltransferase [Herpetosiphonaceae bacterium]|nr:pantetheine-phosphate adenylyltransferase [Herpetosiphonaceae bacterium]